MRFVRTLYLSKNNIGTSYLFPQVILGRIIYFHLDTTILWCLLHVSYVYTKRMGGFWNKHIHILYFVSQTLVSHKPYVYYLFHIQSTYIIIIYHWCLTPLSTIFQLFRDGHFVGWKNPACPVKTTDMPYFTCRYKFYPVLIEVHFWHDFGKKMGNRTIRSHQPQKNMNHSSSRTHTQNENLNWSTVGYEKSEWILLFNAKWANVLEI